MPLFAGYARMKALLQPAWVSKAMLRVVDEAADVTWSCAFMGVKHAGKTLVQA